MTDAQGLVGAEWFDDVRYVVMRILRFAIGLIMRLYAIYFIGMWAKAWFMFGLQWRMALTPWHSVIIDGTDHWFVIGCSFMLMGLGLFGLDLAVGVPYRYRSAKPGLSVRTCGSCGLQVPDEWLCSHCNGFRLAKLFTQSVYAASVLVTVVFVAYDVLSFGLGTVLATGGGGSSS